MNAENFKEKFESVFKSGDVVELAKSLIRIPSHPGLENQETQAARFVKGFFADNGFESEVTEVADGRSNVIARLPGGGGGKNLLLTGHLDTVPAYGMENAFTPEIRDGRLFGRGADDMKGQLAAMICAMKAVKDMKLRLSGDVVFAGVIDEEERSLGTVHLLRNMPKVDAAIVGEPTDFSVCTAHRGLEWLEIHIEGRTVHGGKQSEGLNAISMAAKLIGYMDEKMQGLIAKSSHPLIGSGSYNLGTIRGGTQPSTVAGDCFISLDRRWLPSETHAEIMTQYQEILNSFAKQAPGYKFHMKIMDSSLMEPGYVHEAMATDRDEEIVKVTGDGVRAILGCEPDFTYFPAWTDGGLLHTYGRLPTVIFAPGNMDSAHSSSENIDVDSLIKGVSVYAWIISRFCE